jgi:hypothetical protein
MFFEAGLDGANHVEIAGAFSSVIPGHREAMSPESITPNRGYGFRACASRRIPE